MTYNSEYTGAQIDAAVETATSLKAKEATLLATEEYTQEEKTKLTGIEADATADQTPDEIATAYESVDDRNQFSDAEKTKLGNLEDRFKGIFADATARDAAITAPVSGDYIKQTDTNSIWFYGDAIWVDTGSSSTGDMLSSVYDPRGVSGDLTDRSNHTGTQSISTISGLQVELDEKLDLLTTFPPQTCIALVSSAGAISFNPNISSTEVGYMNGLTSNIQDQLDDKLEQAFTSNPSQVRMAVVNTSGQLGYSNTTSADVEAAVIASAEIDDKLPLSGGTMAGGVDMNNNNIVGINVAMTNDGGDTEGYMFVNTDNGTVLDSSGRVCIRVGASNRIAFQDDRVVPVVDNQQFMADSSRRFRRYYAVDGTISTSDARKKDIHGTDDLEAIADVWFDYVDIVSWSWKGESEKSVGPTAQDIIAAFEAAGVDWREYSLIEEDKNGYYHVSKEAILFIEAYAVRKRLSL